jgi:DNA-binding response OmpR family regulator
VTTKILVVDDDPEILNLYIESLAKPNVVISQATNGKDALLKIQNEKFNLIITDLRMPGLTGMQLLEQIDKDTLNKTTPILISTGHFNDLIIEHITDVQRVSFLVKPFNQVELHEKIKNIVESAKRKLAVDVNVINPIIKSTLDVFKSMFGIDFKTETPRLRKPFEIAGDVSAILGTISPTFKGTLSLSMDSGPFLKIVSQWLNESAFEITEQNGDAIAEWLNIIYGRARKALNEKGMNLSSAIPHVVATPRHSVEHQSSSNAIVIIFADPKFGNCRLEICPHS